MKKYLFAIVALGLFGACHNTAKEQPVVEEEEIAVAEIAPAPVLPQLPVVNMKAVKPINMRDSLKVDKAKGAVIQKKYAGKIVAAKDTTATATPQQMPTEVDYNLTMYYQDGNEDGVYEMDAVYPVDGQSQKFAQTGKVTKKTGTPDDASAVVYEFVPSDGTNTYYFLENGNTMQLLDNELYPAAAGQGAYTITLVE